MSKPHSDTIRKSPLAAFALAAVLSGCFGDGLQSTIRPASDNAEIIQHVYALVTWIDIAIFLVVFVLLGVALVRFRAKKEGEIPAQVHGNAVLELLWTIVPAVLLIFIAVPTWSGIFRAANAPRENAVNVQAVGKQWFWEFVYTDQKVVSANEMHVPVGRPVVVETFSKDVIHSFWAPRLFGKMDTMPGKVNHVWFTPKETGMFYGQCAEFCGTSHANMRFRIIVQSEAEFQAWVQRQKSPPRPETDPAKAGEQLFLAKGCIACHAIEGSPIARGTIGPSLTNLADRTTLASGILDNTPENLAKWIRAPQELKPGALMILPIPVNAEEATQLAAYLMSKPAPAAAEAPKAAALLPPKPAAPAAKAPAATKAAAPKSVAAAKAGGGDAGKGKQVYMGICFACHGPDPGKDGPIGPAITGSSRALIEARVMHGNLNFAKSYPPGYKPKRNTQLMTPFPNLQEQIDDLAAYLKNPN
ncbi:MAG: cytochrome c oxidase subunit II [Candidatus Lambdaproteobacteria bacterium]|nr:cytochrome c oxidase subunit II [Candidatus Lambdaproteobacteria bacterium]